MKLDEIQELFEQIAVPEDADGMRKYMKDQFDFYGIRSPARKELSRQILKALKEEEKFDTNLFTALWQADQRELQYLAQEYLFHVRKWWKEDVIEEVIFALTTKSWWDTVDYISSNVVGHLWRKNPDLYKPILRTWIDNENIWLRRSSIICQLKFREDVDVDFLSDAIHQNIKDQDFFIRKAIGWALRQYSKFHPEWVFDFVEKNELSPLSHREATKYLK